MEYGLLGEKLGHSYSPLIHSKLGNYEYTLVEKAPDELEEFLLSGDYKGLNVTIPYKKAVIPYMDSLTEAAKKIGSVNTVVRRPDGTLLGDNTDYGGFKYTVKKSGIAVKNKKALVLGSGGASLTVCAVLRDMNAASVTVISRSGENNYENLSLHRDADIIVNTTPVGMYPNNGEAPVDLRLFPCLSGVIDIIYNPAKTALLLQAEELDIPNAGGLSMLTAQAALASRAFGQSRAGDGEIEKIRRYIEKKTKNIVLIGMPGCGKTSVGKRLAKLLGRPFIDLDAEIVKAAHKNIPEIFAADGEEAFRRLETLCARSAGKQSGAVISCGGGIVTRAENKDLLRQNGTVVFIQRDIKKLATKGRPLSLSVSPEVLARERMPLYRAWASVTVENIGVGETARLIISFLGLKK